MSEFSNVLEKAARIEMRMAENGSTGQLTVYTHREVRVLLDEIFRLRDGQVLADESRANKIGER